jgi:hypothetical protein
VRLLLSQGEAWHLPDETMEGLSERLKELASMDRFSELLDDIGTHDFDQLVPLLERYAQSDFSKKQKVRLRASLQASFEQAVGKLFALGAPEKIRSIDDYHRLQKVLEDLSAMQKNGSVAFLSFEPVLSEEHKTLLEKKRVLLRRYGKVMEKGVVPGHILFSAADADNEPLSFACDSIDSDDDLDLTIGTYLYVEGEGVCEGLTMSYPNSYRYKPGRYEGSAVERDLISNDRYAFSVTLGENDMIKLHNGQRVTKALGHGYTLTWVP